MEYILDHILKWIVGFIMWLFGGAIRSITIQIARWTKPQSIDYREIKLYMLLSAMFTCVIFSWALMLADQYGFWVWFACLWSFFLGISTKEIIDVIVNKIPPLFGKKLWWS